MASDLKDSCAGCWTDTTLEKFVFIQDTLVDANLKTLRIITFIIIICKTRRMVLNYFTT